MMKKFCFLIELDGSNNFNPHFFKAENSEKALKRAKKEYAWVFKSGRSWHLMEVIVEK